MAAQSPSCSFYSPLCDDRIKFKVADVFRPTALHSLRESKVQKLRYIVQLDRRAVKTILARCTA